MRKVSFFDRKLLKRFLDVLAIATSLCSFALIFIDMTAKSKTIIGMATLAVSALIYILLFIWANRLNCVHVDIEGSSIVIKEGDIFEEEGFKAIPFNEYFDTIVNGAIISDKSLNGIFIKKFFSDSPEPLDKHISTYPFGENETASLNNTRAQGKLQRYNIGTVCVYNDYLLAAFSRFDDRNRAVLTMSDYLAFLNTFWDNVNAVYGQRCVAVPIFGSGITRIKEHKNIEDEELLKIMLWTFKISETRFKYPAKLSIIVHKAKMDKINLFDIMHMKDGL